MILAIVQARMTSTRLPGKVMKKILGRPVMELFLERLRRAKNIDKIIIAIPTGKENDELNDFLKSQGVEVFRGSENDVLDRYYQAALNYKPQAIVRITSDCPLIDPQVVDEVIEVYKKNKADYVSNVHPPTFPDGLDVEVFSFIALERCWKEAKAPAYREHVTFYIAESNTFSKLNVSSPIDLSKERWTLDRTEDLILIEYIYSQLYSENPYFNMTDVLKLKGSHPEVFEVNQFIIRNEGFKKS